MVSEAVVLCGPAFARPGGGSGDDCLPATLAAMAAKRWLRPLMAMPEVAFGITPSRVNAVGVHSVGDP